MPRRPATHFAVPGVVPGAAKAGNSVCGVRAGTAILQGFVGRAAANLWTEPTVSHTSAPQTLQERSAAIDELSHIAFAKLIARPQPRARHEAEARERPSGAVRRMLFRVAKPHEVCLGSIEVAKPASTPTKTHKTKPQCTV